MLLGKSSVFCLAVLSLLVILLTGCADLGGPPPGVTEDQCNGQPNWCVKVANESDDDVDVYVDGTYYGTVSGDGTMYVPFAAGTQHSINACYEKTVGLLQIPVQKVCLRPNTFVASGNRPYIVYTK